MDIGAALMLIRRPGPYPFDPVVSALILRALVTRVPQAALDMPEPVVGDDVVELLMTSLGAVSSGSRNAVGQTGPRARPSRRGRDRHPGDPFRHRLVDQWDDRPPATAAPAATQVRTSLAPAPARVCRVDESDHAAISQLDIASNTSASQSGRILLRASAIPSRR